MGEALEPVDPAINFMGRLTTFLVFLAVGLDRFAGACDGSGTGHRKRLQREILAVVMRAAS